MTTYAIEGVGASVVFGTSSWAADIISFTNPERTREAIDTTHLGTTNDKTSTPAKLRDNGEFTFVADYDPSQPELIEQDPETITITLPADKDGNNVGTLSFSGYCTSFGGEEAVADDRMRSNVTVKITGPITFTAAS